MKKRIIALRKNHAISNRFVEVDLVEGTFMWNQTTPPGDVMRRWMSSTGVLWESVCEPKTSWWAALSLPTTHGSATEPW